MFGFYVSHIVGLLRAGVETGMEIPALTTAFEAGAPISIMLYSVIQVIRPKRCLLDRHIEYQRIRECLLSSLVMVSVVRLCTIRPVYSRLLHSARYATESKDSRCVACRSRTKLDPKDGCICQGPKVAHNAEISSRLNPFPKAAQPSRQRVQVRI